MARRPRWRFYPLAVHSEAGLLVPPTNKLKDGRPALFLTPEEAKRRAQLKAK